jgi:peptidoglycan lytic transglycosylase D
MDAAMSRCAPRSGWTLLLPAALLPAALLLALVQWPGQARADAAPAMPVLPVSTPESMAGALALPALLPGDQAGAEPAPALLAEPPGDPDVTRPGPRADGRPLRLYRNAMVDGLMRFFLERKRDVLERGWRRSGRYLPMIRRIFRAEGVPEELAYLAAVESNFNPHARSPAHAVGLWQFTAPTARTFGLRRLPPWYDERLDPESSTHAAARLLGYLYDRYESWELALAAYNAGEARVNGALARARRRGEAEDYWNLRLPRQTRGFVPAFLALAAIMESPAEHGLAEAEREPALPSEGLELQAAATLAELAERLELPVEALVARNPAWRSGLMPPVAPGPVRLWVPPGTGARLLASLAQQPPKPIPWLMITVQEGETVSAIADRYGVATRDVLALNGMRWGSRLAIGQPLLVPVAADTPIVQAEAAEPSFVPDEGGSPAVTHLRLHRVQAGESLWSIARQYGVRMTELRVWNGLAGAALRPDQELVVYLPKTLTAAQ